MQKIQSHQIKINRALNMCRDGEHRDTAWAMLDAIPQSAITALTARQIAELLDANWQLAGQSKAIAEREACENGFVWDARRNTSRDLAPA